ncbi:MAG: cyclohexanone monooxygenase [Pseudonocardia sp. SCN 72-86]|nr:MAG: cyclohexanone monooxygenase [Pseudonocardia sp. SCN 72-86]
MSGPIDTDHGVEPVELDAVVIGTGFAGLLALHTLRNDLGLEVRAFDDAPGVGGTWYWNCYPGARADTEVTAYCYSFDRDLFDSWRWSERYPRQPEILAYLNHVADRFDLRRSITLDTRVLSATFDEDVNRWIVVTDGGERLAARFLIEGVGLLSSTNMPAFPGQEKFTGEVFHTARWPQSGTDFRGKRVGVIGTGSSGVQVITEIAPEADHLTVFQRSAQYSVPARHGAIDAEFLASIHDDYEGYWARVRNSITGFGFEESTTPASEVDDEEREAIFERWWRHGGGFQFMFATFSDIGVDMFANNAATDFIKRKIASTVTDPETARLLTPTDLYAKRPLCCDGYFETFNRDNVSLVDVKADPIVEITPRGIRTGTTEIELDVIVFATGFDAVTGNTLKIAHTGRGGVHLADHWAHRPKTHLGLMTSGFPNMFTMFGPMGPFTNQPPADEVQIEWIADAIRHLQKTGADTIEPTAETEAAWVATCDEIGHSTLFPKVDSWINGANVPGKPVTIMFYMAGLGSYAEQLRAARDEEYPGFRFTASDRTPA